jgi:hypothetical protein
VTWTVREHRDIQYTVRAKRYHSGYSVDFEVFKLCGWNPDGSVFYSKSLDGPAEDGITEHIQEAEPSIDGNIKWDGCCNVSFRECSDNSMLHGCGREDMTNIGVLFDRLYDLAIELMPEHAENLVRRP